MVSERWGGGSIRGRLVLVALVPILAILPLGVRSAFDDLTLWNETREAEAAASRLSDGAFLEQRVRIEWLSTLDLIAVTSDDMADSTVIDGGLVEIADQARRSFDQAVGDTTQTLETESITAGVFDGRDELLEQVAAGRAQPGEVDEFYTRALSQWEQENGNAFSATTQSDGAAREAAGSLRAINDVDLAISNLRHELTVVITRFFVADGVDWSQLAERSDAVSESITRVDQTTYGANPEWSTLADSVRLQVGQLNELTERARSSSESSVAADLETVVSARNALAQTNEDVATQRGQLTIGIGNATEQMRSAAGRSLATGALLLLFALAVTTFVASKVHIWISRPLLEAAERAHALSAGNLAHATRESLRGPREVRALSAAFARVTDTVQVLEAQAVAINAGKLDDPALEQKLPGSLGRSLEGTIGRWRETTMQLEHEVSHDPITDLTSLRSIERQANAMLEDGSIVIAYVALDHFKGVNDAAGRTTGDRVLRCVGQRIKSAASKDAVTARLWGDEFAILLPSESQDDLDASVEKVVRALADPVTVDGNMWRVSATIGIAEGEQFDRVVNDASVAARYGKRCGGSQVIYHDKAFAALRDKRANIEAHLLTAMANDELEMWFQPVVDMRSREVISAEALLRWPDADGTVRLPGEFIPIAEESDLIVSLDRWAINAVCAQIARWRGTALDGKRIALNISGRHLLQDGLASDISDACVRHGVSPSLLGIEVTETYLASDVATVQRNLEELQQIGVELLLDDFGTGYSSLAYVRDLPFDALKIDRSFVERIEEDEHTRNLVGAIIALARELELSTVAEGIETDDQFHVLAKLGCQRAQGFGLARPMPAPKLVEFVDGALGQTLQRLAA